MQFKSSVFVATVLVTLAIASPATPEDGDPSSTTISCTSANQQCCENTYSGGDQKRDLGLPDLGDILDGLDLDQLLGGGGVVGVGCTNVLGKQCNAQTLCCSGGSAKGGLIATNCAPLIDL